MLHHRHPQMQAHDIHGNKWSGAPRARAVRGPWHCSAAAMEVANLPRALLPRALLLQWLALHAVGAVGVRQALLARHQCCTAAPQPLPPGPRPSAPLRSHRQTAAWPHRQCRQGERVLSGSAVGLRPQRCTGASDPGARISVYAPRLAPRLLCFAAPLHAPHPTADPSALLTPSPPLRTAGTPRSSARRARRACATASWRRASRWRCC